MPFLTMFYGAIEKTFSAWGIAQSSPLCATRMMAVGEYQFFIPYDTINRAPAFNYGTPMIVYRNRDSTTGAFNTFSGGTIAFQGKRLAARHVHDGPSAGIHFTFVNAWWDLENTLYQQEVANLLTVAGNPEYPYVSNLTLFEDLDDSVVPQLVPITTGQQITRILQFLLDRYSEQSLAAPYQIGTIAPALNLPGVETNQMSCADAIRKCLELHPDHVVSLGYSTTPPTFNVQARGSLAAVTLPFNALSGADEQVKAFEITRRDDLVPRSVIVNYRINIVQNGFNLATYATDKYGPHGQSSALDPSAGLAVIVHTLDLTGSSYSAVHLTADLDVEPVLCNGSTAQRLAWWSDERGGGRTELPGRVATSGDIVDLTINDATILDADGNAISLASYPNAIISTDVPEWMQYNGVALETIPVKIMADVIWYDRATGTKLTEAKFIQQRTLTNAPAATYRYDSVDSSSGEGIPGVASYDANNRPVFVNGLAKQIYDALSAAQYESSHVRVAGLCPGDITLANVVNISGGLSAWASARMMVQEIIERDGLGETAIRLGPVRNYELGQLADLWRFGLWFRRYESFTGRQTGAYGGSTINL